MDTAEIPCSICNIGHSVSSIFSSRVIALKLNQITNILKIKVIFQVAREIKLCKIPLLHNTSKLRLQFLTMENFYFSLTSTNAAL